MNAGAYGGEMSQVVTLVEGYNMAGEPFRYSRPDLHFGYRFSRLMKENKIITHVTVQLPPGKREDLLAEMVDFNRRRAEKQPLTFFSAGTAEDFLALMAHVQRVVYRQKGIKLEPEIKILGEDAPVEQV